MGVWIETNVILAGVSKSESHPAWVCGLKLQINQNITSHKVTPCVGVWIETRIPAIPFRFTSVTPCVGVWIETGGLPQLLEAAESHPAWVCGLKLGL